MQKGQGEEWRSRLVAGSGGERHLWCCGACWWGLLKDSGCPGDFQGEVTLQWLPAPRAPTPTPRQRKKQGLQGPKLPLLRLPVSWAGQREAGCTGCRPGPGPAPSCVVRLVGLPWRGEARPAPTHGNFSQGVSHSATALPSSRPGRTPPPSRPFTPMSSCLLPDWGLGSLL